MDILLYLLKANLALVAFYTFYWAFLRKNTFFLTNRYYLLGSVVVSLLMPLLKVKHNYNFANPLPLTLNEFPYESIKPAVYQGFMSFAGGHINILDILTIIYLIGVILLSARLVYSMGKVYLLLINGEPISKEETRTGQNYWLLRSDNTFSSYSFFNFLILNQADISHNRNIITDHEEVHIGQWHSFDVMLLELVQVFFWFNPFVSFYKESLRTLHEFIADAIVEDDAEKITYAEFLFAYNFRTNASNLSNNFFKDSLLKERIKMMMHQRSAAWVSIKYIFIVPLVLILGYFIVVKDVRRGDETTLDKSSVGTLTMDE